MDELAKDRETFSKSTREKGVARTIRIPVTDKACIALLRAQGVSEEEIEKLTMDDFQQIAERCLELTWITEACCDGREE
jgi:hypothetical protein